MQLSISVQDAIQNTIGWVVYKQQIFVSPSPGGLESEISMPTWSGSGAHCCLLVSPLVVKGGQERFLGFLFLRAPNSAITSLHSRRNCLPSVRPPFLILSHGWLEFQHMNLGRTHESIASGMDVLPFINLDTLL